MDDLPAVIVTGTVTDRVIEEDTDHDQDHVTIVANIATDHHLLTAVDHHLRTKENVDPDHNHVEQSLENEQDFIIFAVCQTCHISASLQSYFCHITAHSFNIEFKCSK